MIRYVQDSFSAEDVWSWPVVNVMSLRVGETDHKVVFIGDSNTGKTSIIYKYLNLTQQPFPTIAASSFPISVQSEQATINLNCWDTAGQESYRCLVPIYARGAEVACLVFDQSNLASYESLDHWLTYLQSEVGIRHVIVVSNKNDLEAAVSLDDAMDFCIARNLPLVSTSAVTGTNISFLFVKIAEMAHAAVAARVHVDKVDLTGSGKENSSCC
jgi:small GTP-binding protein